LFTNFTGASSTSLDSAFYREILFSVELFLLYLLFFGSDSDLFSKAAKILIYGTGTLEFCYGTVSSLIGISSASKSCLLTFNVLGYGGCADNSLVFLELE
jgi:hypothetical protein